MPLQKKSQKLNSYRSQKKKNASSNPSHHLRVTVTHLVQLVEHNLEVFLLVHLVGDGVQVVPNSRGAEAAVELGYVVVAEGERLVADNHLGDGSYDALID